MFGLTGQSPGVHSISEITAYLRSTLLQDYLLQDVWLQGEVSNANLSRNGHLFFSLKDASSVIKSVVWSPLSYSLRKDVRDGQDIMAHGRVDLYPPQGIYQFYVDEVIPVGIGLAFMEFERLRVQLEAEGLFSEERKRPLPRFPRRIGLVTSSHGAARRDVENVISQRWCQAEIILAPTSVQGDSAAEELVSALQVIATCNVDVIILARGGGDKEDLACFNHERVARAIASMPVPVITGIGHETDFTIADFVADLRAPTPSAAASLAVPDGEEFRADLADLARRVRMLICSDIERKREDIKQTNRVLRRLSPAHQLHIARQRVDENTTVIARAVSREVSMKHSQLSSLAARLRVSAPKLALKRQDVLRLHHLTHRNTAQRLREFRGQVEKLAERLATLDPLATLERGYALVQKQENGKLVTSAAQVTSGDRVRILFRHNSLAADVVESNENLGGSRK